MYVFLLRCLGELMASVAVYAFVVFNFVVVAAGAGGSDFALLMRLVASLAVVLVLLEVVAL